MNDSHLELPSDLSIIEQRTRFKNMRRLGLVVLDRYLQNYGSTPFDFELHAMQLQAAAKHAIESLYTELSSYVPDELDQSWSMISQGLLRNCQSRERGIGFVRLLHDRCIKKTHYAFHGASSGANSKPLVSDRNHIHLAFHLLEYDTLIAVYQPLLDELQAALCQSSDLSEARRRVSILLERDGGYESIQHLLPS